MIVSLSLITNIPLPTIGKSIGDGRWSQHLGKIQTALLGSIDPVVTARMEIMFGTERRRRWSDEAKLRILAEADETGARIGDVARRHDIHPGQIRLWR